MPNTAPVMSQFITELTMEHIRSCSENAEERATEMMLSTLL